MYIKQMCFNFAASNNKATESVYIYLISIYY